MYKLTARMLQRLEKDLRRYHDLFSGGRCSGWELEELIVNAIKSDTAAHHHVIWKEAGHDDEADITVRTNGDIYPIQIKSGQIKSSRADNRKQLVLSGYRMGRFKDDFEAITEYLKSKEADILSVAYEQINDASGRKHIYQVCYVSADLLKDLSPDDWEKYGKQYMQVRERGARFYVRPSMSWQIWWEIPLEYAETEAPFVI